ncbi:MAG: hypothetical protein GXP26_07960 [Planctomycetes bacterium]|nr:hypothetical protein [Planctomycetota bacterium]
MLGHSHFSAGREAIPFVGGVSDAERESKQSTIDVGDASHSDFSIILHIVR